MTPFGPEGCHKAVAARFVSGATTNFPLWFADDNDDDDDEHDAASSVEVQPPDRICDADRATTMRIKAAAVVRSQSRDSAVLLNVEDPEIAAKLHRYWKCEAFRS